MAIVDPSEVIERSWEIGDDTILVGERGVWSLAGNAVRRLERVAVVEVSARPAFFGLGARADVIVHGFVVEGGLDEGVPLGPRIDRPRAAEVAGGLRMHLALPRAVEPRPVSSLSAEVARSLHGVVVSFEREISIGHEDVSTCGGALSAATRAAARTLSAIPFGSRTRARIVAQIHALSGRGYGHFGMKPFAVVARSIEPLASF